MALLMSWSHSQQSVSRSSVAYYLTGAYDSNPCLRKDGVSIAIVTGLADRRRYLIFYVRGTTLT